MSASQAASFFRVTKKHVKEFEKIDPLNSVVVRGFICRKKGPMGGSLFITHVDGKEVEPQGIYGTPKLAYPYNQQRDFNSEVREFIRFPNATSYCFAEKWNGMNVLFFKYKNAEGRTLVSGKSKGTPFVSDGEFGNFLSMVLREISANPDVLAPLVGDDSIQSVSFELCGKSEPHLVEYSFDLKLQPLFAMDYRGMISPLVTADQLHDFISSDELIEKCRTAQQQDFDKNQQYRIERELDVRYEYEHFKTEGRVLYLLDANGKLIDRTMYKIKPPDIEEVHWQSFGDNMAARVREAIQKIHRNEEKISETTLKEELDMGPKEWSKFGKAVMKLIVSLGAI